MCVCKKRRCAKVFFLYPVSALRKEAKQKAVFAACVIAVVDDRFIVSVNTNANGKVDVNAGVYVVVSVGVNVIVSVGVNVIVSVGVNVVVSVGVNVIVSVGVNVIVSVGVKVKHAFRKTGRPMSVVIFVIDAGVGVVIVAAMFCARKK